MGCSETDWYVKNLVWKVWEVDLWTFLTVWLMSTAENVKYAVENVPRAIPPRAKPEDDDMDDMGDPDYQMAKDWAPARREPGSKEPRREPIEALAPNSSRPPVRLPSREPGREPAKEPANDNDVDNKK